MASSWRCRICLTCAAIAQASLIARAEDVQVLSGQRLSGSGSTDWNVTVQSNGTLAPGNGIGLMTLGGLTFNDGAVLEVESNDIVLDRIDVTGADSFHLSGLTRIDFNADWNMTVGDYVLIDYNGTPLNDFAVENSFSVNTRGGRIGRILHDAANTQIILRVDYFQPWPIWTGGDGSWGNPANWQDYRVPDGVGVDADFFRYIASSVTVTLDENRTVGHLAFDSQSTYTIAPGSGGALTLDNSSAAASLDVESGSHVISAPIAIAGGRTAAKLGQGTLTISGLQTHGIGSVLEVRNGKLILNSNAGKNLALRLIGPADLSVVLGSDQDLKELSIEFAASGTQSFDLHSGPGAGDFHAVSVYADDLDAAALALSAAISHANANGALNPMDGIFDSGLKKSAGIGLRKLDDRIYIRPTRLGDLNLDGRVTIADFIDLAAHFNTPGNWQEGDMNYDGNVTVADFIELASNFNQSYTGEIFPISDADATMLAQFAASVVPEPIFILFLPALAILATRRREFAGKEPAKLYG